MTLNKKILFKGWIFSVLFSTVMGIVVFAISSLINSSYDISFGYILRSIFGAIFITPFTILPIAMVFSLIGVFISIVFKKVDKLNVVYFIVFGVVIVIISIILIVLLNEEFKYSYDFFISTLMFIIPGAFGGCGFWYGMRKHR